MIATRQQVEDLIEHLIGVLDDIDAEAEDLEPEVEGCEARDDDPTWSTWSFRLSDDEDCEPEYYWCP